MRIAELHLTAFGHFTNRRLSLGDENELVVIYGANEAGKSTSLRGLETLLFGFERNAVDQHLHQKMQVGGVFETETKQRVELIRKSGKEPLRTVDGQLFPEETLRGWLRGVDRELFRTLYGLDHVRLREGARALLDSKSSIAESLFDAGIAGAGVAEELKKLRLRVDGTFRANARGVRKPPLNEALKQYFEAETQRVRNLTNYDFVEKQKEGIESAQAMRVSCDEQLRGCEREKKRLERLKRVEPLLARRDALRRDLATLGHVGQIAAAKFGPKLPKAAVTGEARRWIEETTELAAQRARTASAIGALEAVLRALPPAGPEDGHAQRERLVAKFSLFEGNTRRRAAIAKQLETSDETPSTSAAVVSTEQEQALCDQIRRVTTAREELARRAADRAALLDKEALLAEGPAQDPDLLATAMRRRACAERAVLLDRTTEELEQRARASDLAALRDAHSLGLPSLDALRAEVPAPPWEWLEEQVRIESALASEAALTRAAHVADEEAAKTVDREIATLLEAGPLLGEEDLAHVRAERDARVRRAESPEVVLRAIVDADVVADTLRRDAARVSRMQALRARRAELEGSLDKRARSLRRIDAELERVRGEVARSVEGLGAPSMTSAATIEWTRRRAAALPNVLDGATTRERARAAAAESHALMSTLRDASAPQASAEELLAVANARIESARSERDRLERLTAERHDVALRSTAVARQVEELTLAAARLSAALGEALARFDFPEQSQPEDVIRLNAERKSRATAHRQTEELQTELAAIDFEAEQLYALVNAARQRARDHEVTRADIVDLLDELATQSRVEAQRQETQRELQRLNEELDAQVAKTADRERRLQLIREAIAGAADTDVPTTALLERAERAHELGLLAERTEEQIHLAADAADLELLARELENLDVDAIDALIEQQDLDREDLERRKERLIHDQRGYEEALRRVEQESSRSAQYAETAEIQLARVKTLAADWVRHRVATKLLEREIQTYQDLHQGPVLRRASQHFRTLTLGSFDDLRIVINAKHLPELVCVRGKREVGVEGLSDGAKDQLFLALRLATIERHGEGLEPVPLVLDDVLVNFDEERTRSALTLLRELASRMQVLLFTHLERTVELAREASSGSVRVALL